MELLKQPLCHPMSLADQVITLVTANNLTLNDFARNFNYSPSHFSALFLKETGYSPINYYIQLKMRRACQYIERTTMKLNEVAQKVGFNEPAYFSRIFTKIMGMSPSEYRQREAGSKTPHAK